MATGKEYEISNARTWETDSTISIAASARPQISLNSLHDTSRVVQNSEHSTTRPLSSRPTPFAYEQNVSGLIVPTYDSVSRSSPGPHLPVINQQRDGGRIWGRGISNYEPSVHRAPPRPHVPKKEVWAKPAGLITTRRENLNNENASREAEFQRLATAPANNDEFAATGYYLWPKGFGTPMKLFDPGLKTLDMLRKTFKVHIDWNDKMGCLRINSPAHPRQAEKDVVATIEGIKLQFLDTMAQLVSATPLYIVVPPKPDAIRSIVRPGKTEERPEYINPIITSIELAGVPLDRAERLKWASTRDRMNTENEQAFRTHLSTRLLQLKNLRNWMRMRVQFGHINLSQYLKKFALGELSFDLFAKMMKKSRVASGGILDRKMDATIAMNVIRRIIDRESDFCPRKSTTATLSDVLADPKHTEIILLTTPDGLNRRLEAEIESVQWATMGKYQIGQTRLFENDRRNKRIEVTTIDIESKFDWTLEVIQDSEIKNVPRILRDYIGGSLDSRSAELEDSLDLPYPAISLKDPIGFHVQNVVLRSVFQYQWILTSTVVEIAIYREWSGYNTKEGPLMQASVSMFNPDWDTEMDSIENTTLERKWDRELQNFFGKEGIGHKNAGLQGLKAEIQVIQDLLSDAVTVGGSLI